MPIARQTTVPKHLSCSTTLPQLHEGAADLFLVEAHDWITVALLIAARHDSVERKWILLWRGLCFFDQYAEHATLESLQRSNGFGCIDGHGCCHVE